MKRLVQSLVVLAGVVLIGFAVAALSMKPLEGAYYFRGKTPVDAPPGEPTNTHMVMEITGQAAHDLFDSMKVQAVHDECLADNELSKTAGPIACIRSIDSEHYRCSFAINVPQQKIETGFVC